MIPFSHRPNHGKTLLAGAVLALAIGCSFTASAGVTIITKPQQAPSPVVLLVTQSPLPVVVSQGHLAQFGSPGSNRESVLQDKVISGGSYLPVDVAVQAVVPETAGLGLNVSSSVASLRVSWHAGEPWMQALREMTEMQNINILVDWEHNLVVVTTPPTTPVATSEVATPSSSELPPISLSPAVAVAPEQNWVLQADESIRENVERWGKQAGWTIIWKDDVANYSNPAKVVLHGDFASATGPIHAIVQSFSQSKVPLGVKLWPDQKVAYFYNRNYSADEVTPLGQGTGADKLFDSVGGPAPSDVGGSDPGTDAPPVSSLPPPPPSVQGVPHSKDFSGKIGSPESATTSPIHN